MVTKAEPQLPSIDLGTVLRIVSDNTYVWRKDAYADDIAVLFVEDPEEVASTFEDATGREIPDDRILYGWTYRDRDGICTIVVAKPRSVYDEHRMAVLGHELMHCALDFNPTGESMVYPGHLHTDDWNLIPPDLRPTYKTP